MDARRDADAHDLRPDPDALIAAATKEGNGRLKIFLGAAPGVGKTWEMLSAARRRRDEGLDVLVGIVETHGRAETEAQVGDLPVLPRRTIPYRGQLLDEFDLDQALAIRPALLLMDELAHTNVPGSRHAKRWEDVADLIAAGLDVWTTLNVQHLESLNDSVARITGVRVTETLPDHVLQMADEIELVDLPTAELRTRLQEGRVYRPDVAKRALDGFFREGNLIALREMALRRAAEHVDQDVQDWLRSNAVKGPFPAGERVLALIGADRNAAQVVRHAKRLADALRAPWIALHIESRGDVGASVLDVRATLVLATQLGAEIESRAGSDVVATALDVAASRNVTQIVMGRAHPPLWRRITRSSLAFQMLQRAPAYALHVVPAADERAPRRAKRLPEAWWEWLLPLALVAAVTGLGLLLGDRVPQEVYGMVYLAAVVGSASAGGLRPALACAALGFLCWNFFLIPPRFTFNVDSTRDLISIVVFMGVAVATGGLAGRVRAEARTAQARIQVLRRIGAFSRKLGEPTTEPEMLQEIARQAASLADRAVVLGAVEDDLALRAAAPELDTLDDGSWAAARWAWKHQEQAGSGTSTLPSAAWRFLPMRTVRGQLGLLGVRPAQGLNTAMLQALEALADQAAVALERVRLALNAARKTAQDETQKLRTALLSSLSHDLRTPLTSIRGAAEALGESWAALPDATRVDLLHSITDDTARMSGFLTNIMDMTRLETGEITPRVATVPLAEVIEAALARVPAAPTASVNVGSLRVMADPTLLEQVLVNLLENVAKYAPGSLLVRIAGHREGAFVSLSVTDEGIGIPAADLPHVFDSFYRARHGDRVPPGTGLGLAIARGLVEAMDGSIAAASPRPGAAADGAPGTVISIRLPAA